MSELPEDIKTLTKNSAPPTIVGDSLVNQTHVDPDLSATNILKKALQKSSIGEKGDRFTQDALPLKKVKSDLNKTINTQDLSDAVNILAL